MAQHTIGLVGGMSWSSTVLYYRILNETVRDTLGGRNSAKLILHSVNFAEHLAIHREVGWEGVTREIVDIGRRLEAAGADFLVLAVNTIHKVAAEVGREVGLPILHIADAVAEEIKSRRVSRVGLLGTHYTMEEAFYRTRLNERHGIRVLVPEAEDRKSIDTIIYDELVRDVVTEDSKQACLRVIEELAENGAEGIVLGCTELPLLIHQADIDLPVFDTLTLHARAAAKASLREELAMSDGWIQCDKL